MQVVQVHSDVTPPVMTHSPPVCAESTAAFSGLYAFSSCVKIRKPNLSFGGGQSLEALIGCAT